MRHIVTLRLTDGSEATLPMLSLPPVISIGSARQSSSPLADTSILPFTNKTFARINDTLVYEEVGDTNDDV
jgi:hypothetical protein